MKKTKKNKKTEMLRIKVWLWSPWSQSWDWKRVYGEKGLWKSYRFWAGSERERELWMVRVASLLRAKMW